MRKDIPTLLLVTSSSIFGSPLLELRGGKKGCCNAAIGLYCTHTP